MAIVYPDISTIKSLRVQPTAGELHLVIFLSENLDDSYEIYFNPFLDGDRPDIIIVKEHCGIIVIEVKDWNLSRYVIDEKNHWFVNDGGKLVKIKSPQQQVFNYKTNLFNLHIKELGLNEATNKHYFSIVSVFVYFHFSDSNIINKIYSEPLNVMKIKIDQLNLKFKEKIVDHEYYEKNRVLLTKKKNHIERDKYMSFIENNINKLLIKIKNLKENSLFNDLIYDEVVRRLSPPEFVQSQGKIINFTAAQEKVCKSSNELKKVKGIAGCGKTEILSKRAVNARLRHNSEVLILTYNLTLRNLIKDRLSSIQGTTRPEGIEVNNYHQFFLLMCNFINFDLDSYFNKKILSSEEIWEMLFNDESIFQNKSVFKFHTILIDEIQDYNKEWINILKNFFLKDDGEMVLFGDQSQNIYHKDTSTSDNPVIRGFGRWVKLTKSFRSKIDSNLVYLFKIFQQEFISNIYKDAEIFESTYSQGMLNYDIIEYNKTSLDLTSEIIRKNIRINKIIPNDVSIICSSINDLQKINEELDFFEKTETMFETNKDVENIISSIDEDLSNKKIRRLKKYWFMQNSGKIKLSTVHSFKGMESPTIFFILKDVDDSELVYTAITRAKVNLIILDIGNGKSQYSKFFERELKKI